MAPPGRRPASRSSLPRTIEPAVCVRSALICAGLRAIKSEATCPYASRFSCCFRRRRSRPQKSLADDAELQPAYPPDPSDNCFRCHGPDAETREAGLRFDLRAEALKTLESSHVAIVPGDSGQSEMVRRITSTDPDVMMPPPDSNRHLSDRDKALLRLWIDDGAEYHPHWSFVPVQPRPLPEVRRADWARGDIDRFVLARLEAEGLEPAPEADRVTLLRRVTLDLTGLPPTPAEVEAFCHDSSGSANSDGANHDRAYEAVVDRLLASPQNAERMAMSWLDVARYADTHGYNNDGKRPQWPWRDWVIRAFDANMPYDQFVIEQLAGDLLDNATTEQRLATAFNRNHVITSEGGIIPEEYRVEYVADRVHTTATVFLGLSLQCARCHDHKFDPVTQRNFYGFFAFFNNVPEAVLGHADAGRCCHSVHAAALSGAAGREPAARRTPHRARCAAQGAARLRWWRPTRRWPQRHPQRKRPELLRSRPRRKNNKPDANNSKRPTKPIAICPPNWCRSWPSWRCSTRRFPRP